MKKTVSVILTAVAILFFAAGSLANAPVETGKSEAASERKQLSKNAQSMPKPVNAIKLYNEFKTGKQAASEKYRGKNIQVTGVITRKGPDIHSTPSIELSDKADGKSYVICVVTSFEQLNEVSVGDTVTMSGNFHIFGSDDWVVLKKCQTI